jgi:hypothetical protein
MANEPNGKLAGPDWRMLLVAGVAIGIWMAASRGWEASGVRRVVEGVVAVVATMAVLWLLGLGRKKGGCPRWLTLCRWCSPNDRR